MKLGCWQDTWWSTTLVVGFLFYSPGDAEDWTWIFGMHIAPLATELQFSAYCCEAFHPPLLPAMPSIAGDWSSYLAKDRQKQVCGIWLREFLLGVQLRRLTPNSQLARLHSLIHYWTESKESVRSFPLGHTLYKQIYVNCSSSTNHLLPGHEILLTQPTAHYKLQNPPCTLNGAISFSLN